jgi:hypothetical protein
MEADGVLSSELVKSGSHVFFFPLTREVMGKDSFARIKRIDARLRSVVSEHSLPDQREELLVALEETFQHLLETNSSRVAIEDFERELLTAVRSATKKGEVTRYLGVRPMHPAARMWSIGGQLTLTSSVGEKKQ